MLNNQIIVIDRGLRCQANANDRGVIDAKKLSDRQWEELRSRNVRSAKRQLVQCAKCWQQYREVQWLKTYNTGRGTRVISHQAGESRPDHDYETVESPQHRAHKDRAVLIGEPEGYEPQREAWAPDGKTRADVLLTGALVVAYEYQHSPFSATGRYSAPERTRLAAAVGRTNMWHTDTDTVRGMVPILRTDGDLPPRVIRNVNYRLEFRGGIYYVEIYTCTAGEGHQCPNRKFSGCGKPHARGHVTAGALDDVLRGAPVGAYMPVYDARIVGAPRFFWTDRQSYDRYATHIAGADIALLGGVPAGPEKTRRGVREGHSVQKEAELAAMFAQAVDLTSHAPVPTCRLCGRPTQCVDRDGRPLCFDSHRRERISVLDSSKRRPANRTCTYWLGSEGRYCQNAEEVRRFLCGHRCPAHTPAALSGTPEMPPGPGWPIHRKAA
ncbi:hypothetical protein [Streptantibioticus silvisoli]|uniref:Uncharacterized protein n=1 Tax=Streptantibioticus silvisoli TaxID=2705255 RepID=A0ABT6W553_9ACTN|nr:hypothetical protein [Streptantibioticus silvisoli]MDI5965799.1 hypothetical protein [Streptantibioticus silvisoli]